MAVSWIALVVVGYIIWSICGIIDKIIISKGHIKNPFIFTVINGFYTIAVIPIFFFYEVSVPSFTELLIALGSGVTYIALLIPYYKSLQYEEISRVAPLFQLSPVFVLLISFFAIGETLHTNHYIGFILLVAGGILITIKKDKGRFRVGPAFYLILLSAFISAISSVLSKAVYLRMDYINGFAWIRIGSLIAAICILFFSYYRKLLIDTYKQLNNKIKALIAGKIIIDISALLIINYAYVFGSASLITALGEAIYPVFVLIFAIILSIKFPRLLKEEIGKKTLLLKTTAICLIIAGIAAISV